MPALLLLLVELVGGLFVLGFEYWTYGQREVRVAPVMWKARVILYLLLAAPGYFAFIFDDLMPVLLPSIFCTITALVNLAASMSTLPDEKAWRWE